MGSKPTPDNTRKKKRENYPAEKARKPATEKSPPSRARPEKAEQRYRDILESMEEAYYEVDLQGNLTFFNSVAVKRLGYTNEEMMGMNFRQFTDRENARRLFEAYHEVFITGTTIKGLEWEFITRQGERIPVESSVALMKDAGGTATGFRGIVRDITGRRQVQEQLRRSEEQYRAIFENTGSASILFGEDTVIQLVNSNFVKLSGYSKQEIEGKMSWTRFIHRDDLERLMKYHVMRRENPSSAPHSYEFKAVTRTGGTMDIFMTIALIPGTSVRIASIMDITERRRVEEALQQSEAKYRFLTEHMNDVIWTTDLDLNLTYISPSVERMVGFTQAERMLHKPQDMMTPESLARGIAILDRELKREGLPGVDPARTAVFEAEYYHKNGSMVWIENTVSAIRDEQGSIVGIYGVSRDITDRKRSEEALRKSEERYRAIFEHTATANIIAARDTTIILANSNFASITGYSREEMEGRMSWKGFVHPEDLETMKRYRKMREERPGSAPSSYEIRMVHRTGEIRNLLLSSAVLPGTHDTIASMIDITEWKLSEKARSESEERFQELAQLLPETVYEADKYGIFTFVNKRGFEKFGYTEEDLASRKSVFDMIVPDEHARMIATYERLVRGERVGLGEYTARRKDGSTFPALVYATGMFRDGRPVGHRGFIIDMTEKKALEDQVMRAQKMESIGTLAGGIAHDFNNLLMGILGNISLILLHIDQSSPVYERLKSMEDYVQRGSDLTKQLLGFARGGKYEVKPTDIGEFIAQSSELFGRTKREIRIHRNFPEGLWTVEVDQGQLEQVLINLFVNAWQVPAAGPGLPGIH
ncbi:MAG TPA: PAS domain S-box protein, partial [Deltaproteobacteria bacterium]|nr:PAS domain S-box protein [Deltaproteobacteria bacterium]